MSTSSISAAPPAQALASFFLRPVQILHAYRRDDLRPDLVAGLTVALVVLPQAIAYALIADLPPETGLYAAIAGSIVGALWGSSNQLQTGPTNAASLLVLSVLMAVAAPRTPEYLAAAALLAVLVGVFRVAMGMARLGLLVNFVADSVIVGFTAGAGVLIFVNQVRHLLRLNTPSTSELIPTLAGIARHLPETHGPTLAVGLATILIVVVLQRFSRKLPAPLLALMVVSGGVALLGVPGIKVIGTIPRGLPPLASLPVTDVELAGNLATGALAVAAIGLVEAMSIARSIAAQTGQQLDSNQEFIGQGLANIASGLLSGYPCSGSFTRSAVNLKAGARTPLASAFAGLFVLVAMLALSPLVAYIPMSALAGVLAVTAYGLIDHREMARIRRGPRNDRAIMITVLAATLLLPLQFAVLSGILMSLAFYILETSTPRVQMVLPSGKFDHFVPQGNRPACPQLGIMEILGDLYFGAVHHVEECIQANLIQNPGQRFLLLRLQNVEHCDMSGIHALERTLRAYRERGGNVFVSRGREPVLEVMRSTGLYESLGEESFLGQDNAVSYLFYRVLDPAICIYECSVCAFRECQNLPRSGTHLDHNAHALSSEVLTQVGTLSAQELWQALQGSEPPLVLDVREPREFRRGHVPGAELAPLPALLADAEARWEPVLTVPYYHPIVCVCRGGRRSRRVAAWLQEQGYTDVRALQGGILAWEAAGLLEAVEEFAHEAEVSQ